MARRPDSPYSDETACPYPADLADRLGDGDVCWMAQNEGQKVESVGLHFPSREGLDE